MEQTKRQFPSDRYYDAANHFWVQVDERGRLRVGIDALGLETLGDLVYITLPTAGTAIARGQAMGTLEAAKMTGELIAPASGVVVQRNEKAAREPSLVNRDGYGAGWLLVIEPSSWEKESALLVHEPRLTTWVAEEIERYNRQGWINA